MPLPPLSDCGVRPRRSAAVSRTRSGVESLVGAVRHELGHRELAAVVRAEHPELVAALLHGYLMALDGVYSCRLGIKQHDPHVASGVVDE